MEKLVQEPRQYIYMQELSMDVSDYIVKQSKLKSVGKQLTRGDIQYQQ